MRLAFKRRWGFGYKEKEILVILNIGTLEAVCKSLGIEFWQISKAVKDQNFDFVVALLYQGYVTACKECYKKPRYNLNHAVMWYEYMNQTARKEFVELMTKLFGELKRTDIKKKVKENLQS